VIELGWLDRLRTTRLYRYDFAASAFAPWSDATGQWFTERAVEPVAVVALGDLLELHVSADIRAAGGAIVVAGTRPCHQ